MPWQEFPFGVAQPASPGEPFRWWVDLLLLDEVVGRLVDRHKWPIGYWHVHRRAEPTPPGKPSGHIFLFNCRVAATDASEIDREIKNSPAFKFLVGRNLVGRPPFNPRVQDSPADDESGMPYYDTLVKRVWARYVGGLSEMLLQMVREARSERGWESPPNDWNTAEPRFVALQNRIESLWGKHALDFVHHIHAIQGYPLPPPVLWGIRC